jgi:hypothetical protein
MSREQRESRVARSDRLHRRRRISTVVSTTHYPPPNELYALGAKHKGRYEWWPGDEQRMATSNSNSNSNRQLATARRKVKRQQTKERQGAPDMSFVQGLSPPPSAKLGTCRRQATRLPRSRSLARPPFSDCQRLTPNHPPAGNAWCRSCGRTVQDSAGQRRTL